MQNAISLHPRVVPEDDWLIARKQLLRREKELTRLRREADRPRRALPWAKVEKDYSFDGPGGKVTLVDLFEGRSQLIVQHFMFGPDWNEGCIGCSFKSDHVDGALAHLLHHDVTFVSVSRAPFAKIEAFRRRMGWRFKWVSSHGSDFNYDYHVSFTPEQVASGQVYYDYAMTSHAEQEMPGISVFCKDTDGAVMHTYSAYARGTESLIGT